MSKKFNAQLWSDLTLTTVFFSDGKLSILRVRLTPTSTYHNKQPPKVLISLVEPDCLKHFNLDRQTAIMNRRGLNSCASAPQTHGAPHGGLMEYTTGQDCQG